MRRKQLFEYVIDLLSGDLEHALGTLSQLPLKKTINALFSALCHTNLHIRWNAITAFGFLVDLVARDDIDSARVVIRRLIWNLSEESGGIAWGAPESIGEILARNEFLAGEYTNILVSFIRLDGSYLEFEGLQRGTVWGIGRLAQVRPSYLEDMSAVEYLHPLLSSPDPEICGLTAWALGSLNAGNLIAELVPLTNDHRKIDLFREFRLQETTISSLAREAVEKLQANQN